MSYLSYRARYAFCALLFLSIPAWGVGSGLVWERLRAEVTAQPGQVEVKVEYPFKNTGRSSVRIVDIVSGCACTSGTADKATYDPGQAGKVTAKFVVGDLHGRQEKVLSVETDGEGTRTEQLQLVVNIREFVVLDSQWAVWTVGNERSEKTIECAAVNGLSVVLTAALPADPAIAARVETCEPGKRYRVRLQPSSTNRPLAVPVKLEFAIDGYGTAVKAVHAVVRP